MTDKEIASVAHEVLRAYAYAQGDFIIRPWEYAPQWQRDNAWQGVRLFQQHPNAGPEARHEQWLAQRLLDGWKYGPERDMAAKEDPYLVPFEDLPLEERAKDYIFHAVVQALK